MVATFFTFLVMGMGLDSPFDRPGMNQKLEDLVEFLVDHPGVEAPPALTSFFGEDFLEQRRRIRERFLTAPHSQETDESDRKALQDMLDGTLALVETSTSYTLGFIPARPHLLGLITHMFVHANWFHLIGNLLFFFVVGPYLEEAYGMVFLLLLYLLSGLAAAFGHMLRFPSSMTPMVGASGAIAGVMGAFLVLLGASRIRMLFLPVFFLPFWRFTFTARAFIVLPIWFFFQLVEARGASSAGGMAYFAHIGGFSFGALAALLIRATPLERLLRKPVEEQRLAEIMPARLAMPVARPDASWMDPIATRTGPIASPLTTARPPRRDSSPAIEDPHAWSAALDTALDSGNETDIMRCAERLLAAYVGANNVTAAYDLLREMGRRLPQGFTARWGMEAAGLLEKQGDAAAALTWYAKVARRYPHEAASLRALVKSGETMRGLGDEEGARNAFGQARAHPLCDRQWTARIDEMEGR